MRPPVDIALTSEAALAALLEHLVKLLVAPLAQRASLERRRGRLGVPRGRPAEAMVEQDAQHASPSRPVGNPCGLPVAALAAVEPEVSFGAECFHELCDRLVELVADDIAESLPQLPLGGPLHSSPRLSKPDQFAVVDV